MLKTGRRKILPNPKNAVKRAFRRSFRLQNGFSDESKNKEEDEEQMSGIRVKGTMTAAYPDHEEAFDRWYLDDGLRLAERHTVASENDFLNGVWVRESPDNGRTWGEWKDVYTDTLKVLPGGDELFGSDFSGYGMNLYDPASGCRVFTTLETVFLDGHVEAFRQFWEEGRAHYFSHSYFCWITPDGKTHKQMIAFEEGKDLDPENPRDPDFLYKNRTRPGCIRVASDGDLMFPLMVIVPSCCRILGLDVNDVFPSCPQIMHGLMLARAHWNAAEETYELSFSRPVVLSDVLSSRGTDEPTVCELPSGRIVIVFRGSNTVCEEWNTRISPKAPNFKWYTYSDDGGKTLVTPMPWHFDTREVVYSSASISDFFHSSKTGKDYWIGNITDPTMTDGNSIRYPLYICEVDPTYGYLLKDTLTVIDTRREGETELVELSNFHLFEDRETGILRVMLAKIGQHCTGDRGTDVASETWFYEIEFVE